MHIINTFLEFKASIIVLGRVDEEGTKKSGIIKPREISERLYKVEDLIEKPGPEKAFSDLGVLGRYVFNPEIFEAIKKTVPDKKGEIQITDALQLLLKQQKLYAYEFSGVRHDTGNPLGWLKATVALALKRGDIGPELKEYLRRLISEQ